jgi:hypothetical protein
LKAVKAEGLFEKWEVYAAQEGNIIRRLRVNCSAEDRVVEVVGSLSIATQQEIKIIQSL